MNLKGKNILITGASSGIGFELAKQLSNYNTTLFLLARRKEKLDELAHQIKNSGSKVFIYQCDVSDKIQVDEVFEKIFHEKEKIDIAVLNSGVSYRNPADKFDASIGIETFNINVNGIIYCSEKLIPYFIERRTGVLAGVSSLADARGFSKSGFYCASKAAVSHLFESFRVELKKYNIKVVTIKPGFVKTPMTDKNDFKMPFLMNAEKAAKIIIKGFEDEKKIIQFPLQTVIGSKLLKLMPNFLFDKIMSKR